MTRPLYGTVLRHCFPVVSSRSSPVEAFAFRWNQRSCLAVDGEAVWLSMAFGCRWQSASDGRVQATAKCKID